MARIIKERTLPARLKKVRAAMESAGTRIGSVHFRKRSGGELRKMAYRLHVQNPSVANKPKGNSQSKRVTDAMNVQMTVFDVNKVVRNKDNEIVGRGAWRTVPLENVERVVANGVEYLVQ
jgi:hypothetical protein